MGYMSEHITPWDDYIAINKFYINYHTKEFRPEVAAQILRVDVDQILTWLDAGMLASLKPDHVRTAYENPLRRCKKVLTYFDRNTGESKYEYR